MTTNIKTIFALIPIIVLSGLACSTRVEYDRPVAQVSASAININTASVAEIERLPGVGQKTAEAIVEFRIANGPFRRVEHLMLIRGVSETRFAEMRQFIRAE